MAYLWEPLAHELTRVASVPLLSSTSNGDDVYDFTPVGTPSHTPVRATRRRSRSGSGDIGSNSHSTTNTSSQCQNRHVDEVVLRGCALNFADFANRTLVSREEDEENIYDENVDHNSRLRIESVTQTRQESHLHRPPLASMPATMPRRFRVDGNTLRRSEVEVPVATL